jgi:hypothetical protein
MIMNNNEFERMKMHVHVIENNLFERSHVMIDLGLKQMEDSSVNYCSDTVLKLYCLIPI